MTALSDYLRDLSDGELLMWVLLAALLLSWAACAAWEWVRHG